MLFRKWDEQRLSFSKNKLIFNPRAQAEVYKTDFDAERKAREEIAGEKADLMEEIRRLKQLQKHRPENEYVSNHLSFLGLQIVIVSGKYVPKIV